MTGSAVKCFSMSCEGSSPWCGSIKTVLNLSSILCTFICFILSYIIILLLNKNINRARALQPCWIGFDRRLADDGKRSAAGRSLWGLDNKKLNKYRDHARACIPCRVGLGRGAGG